MLPNAAGDSRSTPPPGFHHVFWGSEWLRSFPRMGPARMFASVYPSPLPPIPGAATSAPRLPHSPLARSNSPAPFSDHHPRPALSVREAFPSSPGPSCRPPPEDERTGHSITEARILARLLRGCGWLHPANGRKKKTTTFWGPFFDFIFSVPRGPPPFPERGTPPWGWSRPDPPGFK